MMNSGNNRSIVFFGNEKLATGIRTPEPLIRYAVEKAGFTIEKIVTGDLSTLDEHQSQLAVLAAYGHIIPKRVLKQFPLGIINIHPSLAAPLSWFDPYRAGYPKRR
jgi:methionyl-tRNA formyltransferase